MNNQDGSKQLMRHFIGNGANMVLTIYNSKALSIQQKFELCDLIDNFFIDLMEGLTEKHQGDFYKKKILQKIEVFKKDHDIE